MHGSTGQTQMLENPLPHTHCGRGWCITLSIPVTPRSVNASRLRLMATETRDQTKQHHEFPGRALPRKTSPFLSPATSHWPPIQLLTKITTFCREAAPIFHLLTSPCAPVVHQMPGVSFSHLYPCNQFPPSYQQWLRHWFLLKVLLRKYIF